MGQGYIPTGASTYSWESVPTYASWGSRVLAYIIDGIVVNVVGFGISILLMVPRIDRISNEIDIFQIEHPGLASAGIWNIPGFYEIYFLMLLSLGGTVLVYNILMLSTVGATLGKMALKMRVVPVGEPKKGRLGWGRATARQFAFLLLGMVPFVNMIDLLIPLAQDRRQTLHDMIAQTVVIKV